MDTSSKYVKMCCKATDIQEYKRLDSYYLNGDFVYYRNIGIIHTSNSEYGNGLDEKLSYTLDSTSKVKLADPFWLPRQDQLQEMVEDNLINKISKFNQFVSPPFFKINVDIDKNILNDFKTAWQNTVSGIDLANKYPIVTMEDNLEIINISTETFSSFEQLWLAFIMKEKYNKQWNNSLEQWEIIN